MAGEGRIKKSFNHDGSGSVSYYNIYGQKVRERRYRNNPFETGPATINTYTLYKYDQAGRVEDALRVNLLLL